MADAKRWWRIVQLILALAIGGLAVWSLSRQWEKFQQQEIAWQPHLGWLALSLAIVWLSYAVLIEGWRRVVLSMGEQLTWLQAARVTMVSNLGKYLPGKVWAIAGAAMLAERAGVRPAAAIASALILQALSLASGVLLIALLAPQSIADLGTVAQVALIVLAILAVAGLLLFVVPGALDAIRRWLPGPLKFAAAGGVGSAGPGAAGQCRGMGRIRTGFRVHDARAHSRPGDRVGSGHGGVHRELSRRTDCGLRAGRCRTA